jgi:hypothetical protein
VSEAASDPPAAVRDVDCSCCRVAGRPRPRRVGHALNSILDLLDRVDHVLGGVDTSGVPAQTAATRSALRAIKVRIQDARLTLQEVRRRIERTGQETP